MAYWITFIAMVTCNLPQIYILHNMSFDDDIMYMYTVYVCVYSRLSVHFNYMKLKVDDKDPIDLDEVGMNGPIDWPAGF